MDASFVYRDEIGGSAWVEPTSLPAEYRELHSHPLLAQLLFARGFQSADEVDAFLERPERSDPDPFLLPTMEAAVSRLLDALKTEETIGVFGDYDADGITSVAITEGALRTVAGHPVSIVTRLPTRAEGYGLNQRALEDLAAANVSLLIVVDCGSTDHENVAKARSLGMDVVIVDHHQMSDAGPEGAVVVSAQVEHALPYKELSAAGLCFLLAVALAERAHGKGSSEAEAVRLLGDLAAIGIVADISPMEGAARALVRDGIQAIRRSPRLGVQVLCESSSTTVKTLNTSDIGFRIGPRINAAGRMDDPRIALELLQCDDLNHARKLASQLERLNVQRRVETDEMVEEIHRMVAMDPDRHLGSALVVHKPGWKAGLAGLAAGKIAQAYGRPSIVLIEENGIAHGSARSVPGVNVYQALCSAAPLLLQHGGHTDAAGLSLLTSNVDRLRERLGGYLDSTGAVIPSYESIVIEGDLALDDITMDVARLLGRLSPFGPGNPEPLLRIRDVSPARIDIMGRDRKHLCLFLPTRNGQIRAPFFGAAHKLEEIRAMGKLDLAVTMSVGWWNGQRLDVKIQDLRPAAAAT